MADSHPQYIPCASGGQSQREALFCIVGSLVEVAGYASMQFTPVDARSAAQTLWAMSDSIEEKKTPRIDSQAVEALLDAAAEVVREAEEFWHGDGDADEIVMPLPLFHALEDAVHNLTGDA